QQSCAYLYSCTDTSPPDNSTLSLHDALPICLSPPTLKPTRNRWLWPTTSVRASLRTIGCGSTGGSPSRNWRLSITRLPRKFLCRSEEHTSELQSRVDLVCRLLLAKKNTAQAT